MATPEQQQQLVALTTMMFNAPPGATFLAEFEGYLDQGLSLEQIAINLADTDTFNAQFEGVEGDTPKVNQVLGFVGIDETSPAYQEAFSFFQNGLSSGVNPGALLASAANFLNTTEDEAFSTAAATFKNKVEVGFTHSVTLGLDDTDLAGLQQAVANVTANPASVSQARQVLQQLVEVVTPGDDEPAPGGGGTVIPATPTYTLEAALDLGEDLPSNYNIDENASFVTGPLSLAAAVKEHGRAYEILASAANLPEDGAVENGVDLLNQTFQDLFVYSVDVGNGTSLGNISVLEALVLFYASGIVQDDSAAVDGKPLSDFSYTLEDSFGELMDVTTGLVPAENELLIHADSIVVDDALTADETSMLKSHLQKADASDVQVEFSIVDTLENILAENTTGCLALTDAIAITASDVGDGTMLTLETVSETAAGTTLNFGGADTVDVDLTQSQLAVIEASSVTDITDADVINVTGVTTDRVDFDHRAAIDLLDDNDTVIFSGTQILYANHFAAVFNDAQVNASTQSPNILIVMAANTTTEVTTSGASDVFALTRRSEDSFKTIYGLETGGRLDVRQADGLDSPFDNYSTEAEVNAESVNEAGKWHFDDSNDILTYWDASEDSFAEVELVGATISRVSGGSFYFDS